MSLWEYKIITSGKGGFARPDLLEKFLNDLGRDEWEIIEFHSAPENFLVFTGLARRLTQRDWTLEDAAAAAAKAEAEKLRAEFEAKFKAATAPAAPEERPADFLHEKVAPDDGFRKPVDTSHDADPEADDEEKDEWEQLTGEEDELPTFFEAIKPHMRRNQRGPGMSVGVDYLAKKWDQSEDDLKNALLECGFVVPEDEDAKPEYLEYDGDLYWLNVNRRGELWINTKEKPRPVFRPIKAQKVQIEEERKEDRAKRQADESAKSAPEAAKPEGGEPKPDAEQPASGARESAESAKGDEGSERPAKAETPAGELPQGPALLKKIRPHMRRNRRGPGGSGSTNFLSRALKCGEDDLKAAFSALGLKIPTAPNEKPTYVEVGNEVWWLNADSRGGLWINGRDKRPGETLPAPGTAEGTPDTEATPAPGAETLAEAPTGAARVETAAQPEGAPAFAPTEPSGAPGPEQQPLRPSAPTAVTETAAPVAPVLTASVSTPEARPAQPAAAELPASVTSPAAVSTSGQPVAPVAGATVAESPAASPADAAGLLGRLRPLLKETRAGLSASRVDRVAEELAQSPADLLAALISAGMKVPEKPRERPVSVEHGGEVVWLTRNAKGELWLNAKPAKLADVKDDDDDADLDSGADEEEPDPEKKARRVRSRRKPESEGTAPKAE